MKKLITAKAGVWQVLLNVLAEKMGVVVPNEKLIRVSGQHNYARRVRELRAEGWDIVWQAKNGGGYVLRSRVKVAKSADSYINLKLRQKVLERDGYSCQICGYKGGEKYADGELVKLEVDHILPLHQKGKTAESNLWTLCSRCNAGKKSLLAYPETMKNKIVSLNLPDDLREKVTKLALKNGLTVNSILLDAVRRGLQKIK
jgi:hypothetical protein